MGNHIEADKLFQVRRHDAAVKAARLEIWWDYHSTIFTFLCLVKM
jgi:hypothetical protein